VSDILCGFIEEAGGLARREAYVPELCSSILQRVDVTGAGTDIGDVILDVTVRHPCASRYQPQAARTTGYTLVKAEQEKEAKYPAARGRACMAFAVETWGRISLAADDLLTRLASAAAKYDRRRDYADRHRLQRWRAQLDAALQRGLAAALLSSHEAANGRPRRRPRPEDPLCVDEAADQRLHSSQPATANARAAAATAAPQQPAPGAA